jgi:hypothetical protein
MPKAGSVSTDYGSVSLDLKSEHHMAQDETGGPDDISDGIWPDRKTMLPCIEGNLIYWNGTSDIGIELQPEVRFYQKGRDQISMAHMGRDIVGS